MGITVGARVLLGIASLILALALAGCIQVDAESDFSSDGSARHSLMMSIDRSAADEELLGAAIDFNEVEREAVAAGLEVERLDDDERVGIQITLEADDGDDPGAAMNQLFAAIDERVDTVDAFSGRFGQDDDGTFNFEMTVDGNSLFGDGQGELDLEDEFDIEFGVDMLRQLIEMSYTASMPGDLIDHNGTEISSTEVQWTLPFEGSETFTAVSEDGGGFPLALVLGLGGGFLAVVLVAVGGTVLLRGRGESGAVNDSETDNRRKRDSRYRSRQ